MLQSLRLNNYRCYSAHSIDFRSTTIVVGKNNAGKSTLIEALRLTSLMRDRFSTSYYKKSPIWCQLPSNTKGISPSLDRLDFSFKNVTTQYEDPPSSIVAEFSSGDSIEIFLDERVEEVFAVVRKSNGVAISSQSEAKNYHLPFLSILPQISPLLKAEKALDKDYVKSALYSSLASRHFRNQLSYLNEHYKKFKSLAESSWEKLRIINLTKAEKNFNITDPSLLVQEGFFVTEVGEMGHGLQMWLQTMWFLSRVNPKATVVLDEPDVYMHADLQRKLIRIVKEIFTQVIIATHSLEIMAEVEPTEILVIDKEKEKSLFATDLPTVQQIIYNDIGSIHNLGLARLWSSKKFLWVEGNDIAILKRLHGKMFPKSDDPIDKIPHGDMGGWGGWRFAIGSTMMLKNAGDENLMIYCLFDSDYHIPPDIEARYQEALKKGINLHIWKKKELENYLLNPTVIYRVAFSRTRPDLRNKLSEKLISNKLDEICENMRQEIEDDYSSEISKYYRNQHEIIDFMNNGKKLKYEGKNANVLARKYVDHRWKTDKLSVCPGKRLIKEVNKWLSADFKCSINSNILANEFQTSEICQEMSSTLVKIEQLKSFEKRD